MSNYTKNVMVDSEIKLTEIRSTGFASCVGGHRPDPPIDGFPLLVCVDGVIKTEDGKAALEDLLADRLNFPDLEIKARAKSWRTTEAHMRQLIAYAIIAGLIDL